MSDPRKSLFLLVLVTVCGALHVVLLIGWTIGFFRRLGRPPPPVG